MFEWCSSHWDRSSHKHTTPKGTILIWIWLLFLYENRFNPETIWLHFVLTNAAQYFELCIQHTHTHTHTRARAWSISTSRMSFTPTISHEYLLYYKILLCKYERCITNSYTTKSNSGSTVTALQQILFVPCVKFKTNLMHNTFICYLMLWHVLALTIGNLQGAFFSMCRLYCSLYVRNTTYD
jgi:hypothetical protein